MCKQASSPALRIYDIMYYKRKAYHKLLEWKQHYSDKYAILLEGARRVGKSTIAENFDKSERKITQKPKNYCMN